ncbi:MAG: starch-binding protein [Clostridiales bacterium]|nr:starch-binding protein [Clostridiales bacterium]
MKILVAIVLCLMMLPMLPAMAEDAEMIIVYASVPADWSWPCIWAWSSDGTNAFASWPGDMMEPDAANEGWYYIYLPAGMESVIINANDGGVQTDEIKIDKKSAWVTVADDKTAAVFFEAQTAGEAPAYTERFTVHAQVDASWKNPCIWAWADPAGTNAFAAWPGRVMKPNENGWYLAKVPVWCNSIIINGNAGSVQTADIKDLDPANLWVSVHADATFEVTYEDPTAPKADDITVYAKVPEEWASPSLWAWSHPDGTNAFVSWPGEALIAGDDGWYAITVPGWINSVIINANEGSVQTTDLRVDAGKDLYVTVISAQEATVAYEKPAE